MSEQSTAMQSKVRLRHVQGQRGIQEFTAQLRANDIRIRGNILRIAQSMAFVIAEAVVVGNQYGPGTPVDTGFARANWTMAINGTPPGQLQPRPAGREPYPAPDIATDFGEISNMTLGDALRIANNAAYGMSLEYGHSQQAPMGMVRIVIAAGQSIADDVVAGLSAGPQDASP